MARVNNRFMNKPITITTAVPKLWLWIVVCALSTAAYSEILQVPEAPRLNVSSYILIDADTGTVIAEQDADRQQPVASLNKVMLAYVIADQIAKKQVDPDSDIPISRRAQSARGSRSFLRAGTRVPLEVLMRGLAVQSGNDAAVALAEHVGGDEVGFVSLMNTYAQSLGLTNTEYSTSSGLPHPDGRGQHSTARDQAQLAQLLVQNFPDHYELYRMKQYQYNGITQRNRNKLLWLDGSVDGMKTGHTSDAGYCLIASAQRDSMRLISVLLGAESEDQRTVLSRRLLEYGFRYFTTVPTLVQGEVVKERARVWGGITDSTSLGVTEAVRVTIPRGWAESLERRIELDDELIAPVAVGDVVGKITIRHPESDTIISEADLQVLRAVHQTGPLGVFWSKVQLFFFRLTN